MVGHHAASICRSAARGGITNSSRIPGGGVTSRRSTDARAMTNPPMEKCVVKRGRELSDTVGGLRGRRAALLRRGAAELRRSRFARRLAAAQHGFLGTQRYLLNLRLSVRLSGSFGARVVPRFVHGSTPLWKPLHRAPHEPQLV